MEVYPVIVPRLDWDVIDDVVRSRFNFSPKTALVKDGFKSDDPGSIFATLALSENLRKSVLERSKHGGHVVLGFLIVVSKEVLFDLHNHTKLLVTSKCDAIGEHVGIISGGVDDWLEAFRNLCTKSQRPDTRRLANMLMAYFEQTMLKKQLNEIKKSFLADGTFILE